MTGLRYAARLRCGAPNASAMLCRRLSFGALLLAGLFTRRLLFGRGLLLVRCLLRLARQRLMTGRLPALALQRPLGRLRSFGGGLLSAALAGWRFLAATFGRLRFLLGRFPFRRHVDPGAPCFRKADGYRLLGGPRAVLAFAHMLDLFAHELTGLRGRRLSFPLFLTGTFDGFLLRHDQLLCYLYPSIHREYRSRN